MLAILRRIFRKRKEQFVNVDENNDLTDIDKLVLKMCNGEAVLYDINKYCTYFKYEGYIYGIWMANGVDSMGLNTINGEDIEWNVRCELQINNNIRIKFWNQYACLYEKCRVKDKFSEMKKFEEKYSIKIIKN